MEEQSEDLRVGDGRPAGDEIKKQEDATKPPRRLPKRLNVAAPRHMAKKRASAPHPEW